MISFRSIRIASAISFVGVIVGCAQQPKLLYSWESFPRQQYDTLLHSGVAPEDQIRSMQAHVEKARGTGSALPPGFRAHMGMLYLSVANVDEARKSWQSEKATFPESVPYMDQLLKRLDAPTVGSVPK